MRFTIILVLISHSIALNSQIQTQLIAVCDVNNKLQVASVNPNTGHVSPLGTQTLNGLYGGLNSAVFCPGGDFILGGYLQDPTLLVIDRSNGSINSTFNYPITAIASNAGNGLMYGMQYLYDGEYNFVAFNPIIGTYSVLSSHSLQVMTDVVGYAVDPYTSRYMTLVQTGFDFRIASFSCANGSYTLSPKLTLTNSITNYAYALAFSINQNKLYGLGYDTTGARLCEISPSTGSMTAIGASIPGLSGMSGGSDARGGVTIDEQSNTYTIKGYKLFSIDLITGGLKASPSISVEGIYFIQYSSCHSIAGISEQNFDDETSSYFDFFGNPCNFRYNTLLIERKGNKFRKVYSSK